MLTTQQEHELPSFPFSSGVGVTTWRAVTLHFGTPYVFVNYAIRQGRQWLSQTTIFWRHEDVLNFCRATKKDKKRKLLDIFMLVPTADELAHKWSLVSIGEIFVGKYEEDDFPIYVTVDGDTIGGMGFASQEGVLSDEEHLNLERVFCVRSGATSKN